MADENRYAGLTLDEAEELAAGLVARLASEADDAECYAAARVLDELIPEHRGLLSQVDLLNARIALLRKAPRS